MTFVLTGICNFPFPIGYAIQAYKEARFELPLMRGCRFVEERIHKDHPDYADILSRLPGTQIKTDMQPFLEKVGIRKSLIFCEQHNPGFCCVRGTNMFTKGDAAVLVVPDFYKKEKDACCWVLKHEISHIKHNDMFTMHCVPGICQLAASIFGTVVLPFWPAVRLAFVVGMVSSVLFSRWREAKADDFAIENSSDEELKSGRRFLMALQKLNIEVRNMFWKRIALSANGENRLDVSHPSLASRIQKIEQALHAREAEIDENAEKAKLEDLRTYMADELGEIRQVVEQVGFFDMARQEFSLS